MTPTIVAKVPNGGTLPTGPHCHGATHVWVTYAEPSPMDWCECGERPWNPPVYGPHPFVPFDDDSEYDW